jgi:hypothetical protein
MNSTEKTRIFMAVCVRSKKDIEHRKQTLEPNLEDMFDTFGNAIEKLEVVKGELPRRSAEYRFLADLEHAWETYLASG